MNAHTESRLALVYPELARRVRQADRILITVGFRMEVSQGLRTWAEQDAIFRQGRDSAGNIVDPTKVATHARGGESYHNYGLAIDFFFLSPDGTAIWNADFPGYARAVDVFGGLGLVCGAHWPEPKTDADHVQLTQGFADSPDDRIKYIFKEAGFKGVFEEMNRTLGIAA